MRNALAQAGRLRPLSVELAALLDDAHPSDAFRAELLLGYMNGLPAEHKPRGADAGSDPLSDSASQDTGGRDEGENT